MFGTSVRLLAKSGLPPIYLDEHTEDVVNALKQILRIWPDLPPALLVAAQFHDFGKGAEGFQKMLLDNTPWGYRHEVLSAAIFLQCHALDDPDMKRSYLALLSHHKNFLDSDQRIRADFRHCQTSPNWYTKWGELNVAALRALFPNDLATWQYQATCISPADDVGNYAKDIAAVFDDRETALCRGALVAADHLASAKLGVAITGNNINSAALEAYAKTIKGWRSWSELQNACQIPGNALLVAPTGAGKTEAALLWALHNRLGSERIFYVLPYQVSINAMAERISRVFPFSNRPLGAKPESLHQNDNLTILHSNTDLAYLQDALNDKNAIGRAISIALSHREAARKIYAPIKITTVYQLLDIFFGRKFFEVGLLELTNAVVIFDEIHAYDGHTLGLIVVLMECLRKLQVRVFIMTATMPLALRATLQQAANIPSENIICLSERQPQASTEHISLVREVRRKVFLHERWNVEELVKEIRDAVARGKRTVVVCNTVDKAISLWEELNDLKPYLVHSRFTIGHRAERERKEVLEAVPFLIATQVIEVSLDISFDVMFTELAPIDSLLQRFGRVKRHGSRDPDDLGICHIACGNDSGSSTIYGEDILNTTRETLLAEAIELPESTADHKVYQTPPLDFLQACLWIESVYPDGLTAAQRVEMDRTSRMFRSCVAELRPMCDPSDNAELELTLFDSVQVVPHCYAKAWQQLKKDKMHIEAKRLIVNVDSRVWCGAKRRTLKAGFPAYREIEIRRRNRTEKQIVALFEYDEGTCTDRRDATGLRLQNPLPANFDVNEQFVDFTEDDD